MVRSYRNGEVPSSWLIQFASGYNASDGAWVHSLPPSTYRKHLALVAIAKRSTGRDLKIGVGWCAYRPLGPQKMLKKRFGIMAATPGTSSHGGLWEGRQVMAIDYSNWSSVYGGDRAAWFRDVRAAGFVPDMISPRRGYPDEPWHVIDYEPWAAIPSGGGSSSESEEDDMYTDADRKRDQNTSKRADAVYAAVFGARNLTGKDDPIQWVNRGGGTQLANYGLLAIDIHTQTLVAQQSGRIAAIEEVVEQLAKGSGAVLDMKAISAAAEAGTRKALSGLTLTADVG